MRDSRDYQVVFRPTRPDFAIRTLRGTSTSRGYHETFYEIVSRRAIDVSGWKCLDACGLIGIGQAYHVHSTGVIVDQVAPVNVDRRTGEVAPGPCLAYNGEEITKPCEYDYHRYVILRIMDSGD